MQVKCHYCGTESEWDQAFFKVPRSFGRKPFLVCPDCFQKRSKGRFKRLCVFWAIGSLLAIALLFFPKGRPLGLFILNCNFLDFCLLFTIVPHELAHGLTAELVGFRVFNIIVGTGETFYKRRLRGFRVEIKRIPFGGVTDCAPKKRDGIRWRWALTVAAGPLISILFGGIAYIFMQHPTWPDSVWNLEGKPGWILNDLFGARFMPLEIIFFCNVLLLVTNALPRHINSSRGRIPNDGLQLWQTLFMTEEKKRTLLAAYYNSEAFEAYQERHYADAEKWSRDGLKLYPENEYLVNMLGVSLLESGRLREAREIFLKQIDPPAKAQLIYGLALNNVAYADVLLGDVALLPEADEYSRLAMQKLSWFAPVKGTRGAVLVQLKQLEEGIVLLKEAMAKNEQKRSKAANACFLSLAERTRGNLEEAENYLKTACTFDPDSGLLKRICRDGELKAIP